MDTVSLLTCQCFLSIFSFLFPEGACQTNIGNQAEKVVFWVSCEARVCTRYSNRCAKFNKTLGAASLSTEWRGATQSLHQLQQDTERESTNSRQLHGHMTGTSTTCLPDPEASSLLYIQETDFSNSMSLKMSKGNSLFPLLSLTIYIFFGIFVFTPIENVELLLFGHQCGNTCQVNKVNT